MFATKLLSAMTASATVPLEVIGPAPVEMPVPALIDTTPAPGDVTQARSTPGPFDCRMSPAGPGGRTCQPAPLRKIRLPVIVEPSAASIKSVNVAGAAGAGPEPIFPSSVTLGIDAPPTTAAST